eukprot:516490_1
MLEKWVRMKKNHISYTNGGSGVATTEKKVKLFITVTVKAFCLHTFDRLHNSGGDSKCQFCEQTIGGAAQLTSYDMDTSLPDGVSFAAASAADLTGFGCGRNDACKSMDMCDNDENFSD